MKTITVGTEVARLRAISGETLDSVAKRCDIAESTVWKVENDAGSRWETVHLILKIGLRVAVGSDQYRLIQALWTVS